MTATFQYDIDKVKEHPHHTAVEELVDMLCHRTGNINREFFQAEAAYFLSLVPSSLRTKIDSPERGLIPVNIYVIALATSGFGKGHSVNLMEEVLSDYRQKFMGNVFHQLAETNMFDLAVDIAAKKSSNEAEELAKIETEFKKCGTALWTFDSGTGPALKQLRQKLLMAGIGSLNFQMDEMGSNLVSNAELLNPLLELYDLGNIKTKLIKNSNDNERGIDIVGSTPANVLMFGTTSKLFDGAKTEDEFFSFLETGYARRCIFGLGKPENLTLNQIPEDVYRSLIARDKSHAMSKWKTKLAKFADPKYYNRKLSVSDEVGIELVAYRLYCESESEKLPEHEVIRKAELSHRYFKVLKLAGVYAFLDDSLSIEIINIHQAIRLVEESGTSFQKLLNRERNFARLAKYIAAVDDEITHADLVEDLPYYPTSVGPRKEIMDLAMAWGVRNHVVIKRNVVNSVDFFSGSTLQENDLTKLSFTYSTDFASDYTIEHRELDDLPKLLSAPGLHWCNHAFENDHRSEKNVIPGFNMIVLDVDGEVPLKTVHEMLKEYTFITATTKRHTEEQNRFRIIMPTNYVLKLDSPDYKEFMNSFMLWLPFKSDTASNQRSKKWMTYHKSNTFINRGTSLIDVLPFIPKTKLNQEYVNSIKDLGHLDNLERWFLSQMDGGYRNNNLLNFAMMLKDSGMSFDDVKRKILTLNERCINPLKKAELNETIFKSVGQKYSD